MTDSLPPLPPRPEDAHKGTFGTVGVVGGVAGDPEVMLGGPAFTALGALRSGAGRCLLAMPRPVLAAALSVAPEATGLALPVDEHGALAPSAAAEAVDAHADVVDCWAIGPGLGAEAPQQQFVHRLLAGEGAPIILDADGLNALARMPDCVADLRGGVVLTPHPGEFRRLAEALRIDGNPVEERGRVEAAQNMASRCGCVVVLKGKGTVVTDGLRTFVNETGNPALATAGSGDVLAGLVAGFVAQFRAATGRVDLLEAARLGVWIHGRAGDDWASVHGHAGMLAGDLLGAIPAVLASMARS